MGINSQRELCSPVLTELQPIDRGHSSVARELIPTNKSQESQPESDEEPPKKRKRRGESQGEEIIKIQVDMLKEMKKANELHTQQMQALQQTVNNQNDLIHTLFTFLNQRNSSFV